MKRRWILGCAAAFVGVALGGCVDQTAELSASPEPQQKFVLREGASLAAATTAIVSVDGAPAPLAAAFDKKLGEEARARSVALVDPKKARYLVRGYLSAELTSDGAVVEYVWDVFTQEKGGKDKRRAQRLTDSIAAKGSGDDPWQIVGPAALDSIAARCADDLAAYLSNTPEAGTAAPALAAAPTSAAPNAAAGDGVLSYAPTEQ